MKRTNERAFSQGLAIEHAMHGVQLEALLPIVLWLRSWHRRSNGCAVQKLHGLGWDL